MAERTKKQVQTAKDEYADRQWLKNKQQYQKKKATKALSKAILIEQQRLDSGEWHYITRTSKVGRPISVLVKKQP